MSTFSPFLRSVCTDITGGMVSHQLLMPCASREMAVMDCMEAYGWTRGLKKCQHLVEDFKECQLKTKQYKRFMALRKERDRKIEAGILCGDKKYVNPTIDSY